MNKNYICDIEETASNQLLDIVEMKSSLESLAMQIAENNDIIKEDSLLYARLIDDYRKSVKEFNAFWEPYYEKYGKMLVGNNAQFSVDFATHQLFAISE